MSFAPFSTSMLQLLAETPVGGFALQNATPTILSWTAPSDGLLHVVTVFSTLDVTSALTGGHITTRFTDPLGNTGFPQLYAANETAGVKSVAAYQAVIGSGTTITVNQGSAVTAGAAVFYAQMWGV